MSRSGSPRISGRAAPPGTAYLRAMRTITAMSLAAAVAGTAAMAYDPIVLARGWERVDAFESGDCTGEVGTNGRFYVISVSGFTPGERAFLTITNGDMRPSNGPCASTPRARGATTTYRSVRTGARATRYR